MADKTETVLEKAIKGLKYHTNRSKEVIIDGQKVTKYEAVERDMTPADVLSSKEYTNYPGREPGKYLAIVSSDGQKNIVKTS